MMQTNRRGGGRMLRPELQYTTECEAPSTRMQLRMWMQRCASGSCTRCRIDGFYLPLCANAWGRCRALVLFTPTLKPDKSYTSIWHKKQANPKCSVSSHSLSSVASSPGRYDVLCRAATRSHGTSVPADPGRAHRISQRLPRS